MRLIYLTTLNYPSELANHTQVKTMARNFQTALAAGSTDASNLGGPTGSFLLVVNSGKDSKDLSGIKMHEINSSWKRLRIVYVTFWFLRHARELMGAENTSEKNTVFYCKDSYLCAVLILFKKIFGYKVGFESHLVFNDWRDRFIARHADAIVAVTSYLKKKLVGEYGASEKRILVSPDAVDLEIFDISLEKNAVRMAFDLPADKIIFGYTGRFKTMGMDKGIAIILQALRIINNPNVLFLAVGGSEKDITEYAKMAAQEGVSQNVMFKGYVSQADLARYQKACDALLMPFPYTEHYAYYMSPLKMFEYMASKVPMVVSDLPSVRDVLDEKTALVVEPGNEEGLAETLKKIAADPKKFQPVADEAYKLSKRYTWSARAESIIAFIS